MVEAVDIIGCMASLVGLVVSFLAWRSATSAKVAAMEARDAVYRENLKKELNEMTVLATQMLSAIRRRDSETVGLSAITLLANTEYAISRWGSYLEQGQRDRLAEVPELIASIDRTVLLQNIPAEVAPLKRMVDQCQNAMRTMNSVLGSIHIESESTNG